MESFERFMRTLKEEHISYSEYESFEDAVEQIQFWVEDEYMTERIHSSLAYLTPYEFELAHGDSVTFGIPHLNPLKSVQQTTAVHVFLIP